MSWLPPSMTFMALASIVLSATFLYVWQGFIRRRYVLLWSLAWLVAVPHIGFSWFLIQQPEIYAYRILASLTLLLNVLLMVSGCYDFLHNRLPKRTLGLIAAPVALILCLLPAVFSESFLAVSLPGSLLLAASYLFTGGLFLRQRRTRDIRGSRLVAILFILAGLHELDFPLLGDRTWAAPVGYLLASMLALAIAASLLVLVLEQSRSEAVQGRAKLQALLDHLPAGVLLVDPNGQISLVNGAAESLLGPLAGRSAFTLFEGHEAPFRQIRSGHEPEGAAALRAILAGGQSLEAREFELRRENGGPLAVLVNAGPVKNDSGESLGAVLVCEDIQVLKSLQVEMARSKRLKSLGTLAAGVAHDFNNVLMAISGHSELAASVNTDPGVGHHLQTIIQASDGAAAAVRRIQDATRTHSLSNETTFNLSQVCREVVDLCRPRWRDEAEANGVSYDVQIELEDEIPLRGHPGELREALLNLLFNALDAMPEGGTLTVSAERVGEEARLSISDDGVGMRPEVKEHAFDPFYTTKQDAGTGLGLAIVQGVVDRHKGRLAIESEPGEGTSVVIDLPSPTESGETFKSVGGEIETEPRRILVVEDEAVVREVLCKMLRQHGHLVATAESGEEALVRLSREKFELVLTDVGMPSMNGWELASLMRAKHPEVKIVLATGWGQAISPEQARAAGISHVLTKPFRGRDLQRCLHTLWATNERLGQLPLRQSEPGLPGVEPQNAARERNRP